ncbi:MAG: hypothetical protein J5662_01920, partial [Clostridia bacterium]|nr:hypothetical protein [Clostridia bacterium]
MSDKVLLTNEQKAEVVNVFKKNDFTKNMSLKRNYSFKGENAKVFLRAKQIFGGYWLENLRPLGINRSMKNFSSNYTINFLENADADFIAESVANIFSDPQKFDESIEKMFTIYADPIEDGLIGYAGQLGKDVDDLTDEEIMHVVENVADIANKTGINIIMQAQQVPEIFGISRKIPQHEDFSDKLSTDKINFHKKWTHSDTKLGAPLLFSELSEDEATDIEGAKNFFGSNPGMEIKYNFFRDEYAKTLDGVDKEIYYLSEQGYKQKEIAEKLGYKNHSAVSKRMKKMNA